MASEEWSTEKWLKKIGMSKYKQAFRDNGYETAELCASLSEVDMEAIGISNKNHKRSIFTQVGKLKEILGSSCEVGDSKGTHLSAPLTETQLITPHNSTEEESQCVTKNIKSRNRFSFGSSIIQTDLADYSEPWNGASITSTNDTSPMPKQKQMTKVSCGTPTNPTDVLSTSSRSLNRMRSPISPVLTESTTVKKDTNTGMTSLQLKLKIRDELFMKNIVLSEKPYCSENGSPEEHLMLDLATELADRFDVESLSMYDALQEVWANANKCSYSMKSSKPKIKVPLLTKRAIDEPFASTNTVAAIATTHRTQKPMVPLLTACSMDNYDEPLDSTKTAVVITPTHKPLKIMKSGTLSSSGVGDLADYVEPFDPIQLSSPENKKAGCNTLPNRKTRGNSPSEHNLSPHASPRNSPLHTSPSKGKFSLFKRKDKKRTSSLLAIDLKHIDEMNKRLKEKVPSPGLLTTVPLKTNSVSVEDLTEMGVLVSAEQKAYIRSGLPPPLPTLRTKQVNGESGESDDSAHISYDTQSSTSKQLGGAINTLPNLNTYKTCLSRDSNDDEFEPKAWATESRKSTQSEVLQRPIIRDGKSRTSLFFSRLFKQKTSRSGIPKKFKRGKTALQLPHRDSLISNSSSIGFESRERCLTASMSMPDIDLARSNAVQKVSASHLNNNSSYNSMDYSEVLDSIPPEKVQNREGREGSAKKKLRKKPTKPPREFPWVQPSPPCSPTIIHSTASLSDIMTASPCHSPVILSSSPSPTDTLVATPPISISPSDSYSAPSHSLTVVQGVSNSCGTDQIDISMNAGTAPSTLSSTPGGWSLGEDFMCTRPLGQTIDYLSVTSNGFMKCCDMDNGHSLVATCSRLEIDGKNDTASVSVHTPPFRSGSLPEKKEEVVGENVGGVASLTSQTRSKTDEVASARSPRQRTSPKLLRPKPNRSLPRQCNPTRAENSDDGGGVGGGIVLSSSPSKSKLGSSSSKTNVAFSTSPKPIKAIHQQYQRPHTSSTNSCKDDSAPATPSTSPLSPCPLTAPLLPLMAKKPPKPTRKPKAVKVATTGQTLTHPQQEEKKTSQTLTHPQQEKKTSTLEKRSSRTFPKDKCSSLNLPSSSQSKTSTNKNVASLSSSSSPKPLLLPKPAPRPRVSRAQNMQN